MWQISYLPANGASLGNYFGGLVPNKKNICDSVQKLLFLGQIQAKWGQSKWLLHPNLQTFFDEVIIFGLVGDEVKIFPLYLIMRLF